MRVTGTLQIPDVALEHLPRFAKEQATYRTPSGNIQRRKAQFVLLDYHPETFRHHRSLLPVPLPYGTCLRFALDLIRVWATSNLARCTAAGNGFQQCDTWTTVLFVLCVLFVLFVLCVCQAAVHMQLHQTVHLDLKPDNILVALDGRAVLCDFGTALQFDSDEMTVPFSPGMSIGGNTMHLAPEVLNEHDRLRRAGPGARGRLCYRNQEVWATGVLIHSMIFGCHPWPDYPNDCGGVGNIHYNVTRLPPYPSDYPDGVCVCVCVCVCVWLCVCVCV